jgi:thioredoxin-disulfide reductase
MHEHPEYDLVIVGGGIVGFAASVYAGRFRLKTLLVGDSFGGTLSLTHVVENYPGFKTITGLDLTNKVREHAMDYGIEAKQDRVASIERCSQGCYKVSTENETFHTHTILFATGTEWRKLDVSGEKEFANKGVHYCATCDGMFYRDKIIAVVGGSDSAAKEALLLSEYGKKVYVIYRGESIRPEPINRERVEKNPKIEIINNTKIEEIKGDEYVTHVILDKPYRGSKELEVDGLFVEIGHVPISDLAIEVGVQINEKREIKTDRQGRTNLPGFYAAGDVTDLPFKQAITGVGEAITAVFNAYNYIREHEPICSCDDEDI